MLRDGEVPEGRAEVTIVQKTPHGIGHSTLEPLQGTIDLVDDVYWNERTIRRPNQNGGERSADAYKSLIRLLSNYPRERILPFKI